jgi:hypothetical protein
VRFISRAWNAAFCVTRNSARPRALASAAVPELQLGAMMEIEVEVRSSVTHTLTVGRIREWLQRGRQDSKRGSVKGAVAGDALTRTTSQSSFPY